VQGILGKVKVLLLAVVAVALKTLAAVVEVLAVAVAAATIMSTPVTAEQTQAAVAAVAADLAPAQLRAEPGVPAWLY